MWGRGRQRERETESERERERETERLKNDGGVIVELSTCGG